MSALTRTLCAASIAFALATSAFAQQGEPWSLQEGKAYVVDMQGKMKMMQPKDQGMALMKKRAKPVPKGMVFFMNNGQLYMMQANRSLFETNF
jgi:Flp pilus assembly protein TadD